MADIIINPGSSIMSFTSSLNYTQTLTQDASGSLILAGSGSLGRTDLFTVNGNNGTLFSVSDDLSDSLFSVNTIAGLPVIEAFANNTVVMGQYGQNVLVITGSRIGIGTSAPASQLHIRGVNTNITLTDTTYNRQSGIGYLDGANLYFANDAASNTLIGANNGVFLAYGGGSVGINTTSPSAKLDVGGGDGTPAGSQFAAVIKGADSGNRTLYFDGATQASVWWGSGNTPQFAIDSISGGGATFWTNDGSNWSERMRILVGGNVGIGSTSPNVKLDVVGTGHFGSPSTADQGLGIYSATGTGDYSRIRFYQSGTNIHTIHSFSTNWQSGTIYNSSTGALNLSGQYGITIGPWNDPDAIFVSSGATYLKGNVGIGVTNPSYKLHVNGDAYINGVVRISSTNPLYFNDYGGGWYMTDSDWVRTYNGKSIWVDTGYLGSQGGLTVGYGGTAPGSGGAIIAGSVGIGTSPDSSHKLHVYSTSAGNARIGIQATTNYSLFESWNNSGALYVGIDNSSGTGFGQGAYTRVIYADGNYPLAISTNGTQRMTITGGGNVGIGTTSPSSLLDVGGYLTTSDGNLELYKSYTVDMSNTGTYSTSNYYPVIIPIGTEPVQIQVQVNLNSNVPSWANHPAGFTLNVRWITNGSGWGTAEVKRKVYQYHEGWTTATICGGITQMTQSSTEVIWLRGGGTYYFKLSRNFTPSPQASTYTSNGQSVSPTSTAQNTVWNSASGNEVYFANQIYTNTLYDWGNANYYLDPASTSNLYTANFAGVVAIGTTYTYGNALSVSKGVSGTPSWDNATLELRSESGLTAALAFHRAGYTASTIYSDDGSIAFGVGGERMRIASGGNVGIGTTSPTTRLHVETDESEDGIKLTNGGTSKVIIYNGGLVDWGNAADYGQITWDTGKAIVQGKTGKALSLGANSTPDYLYINTSGNVGIGATSVSYKLHVEGDIYAANGIYATGGIFSWDGAGTFAAGSESSIITGTQAQYGITSIIDAKAISNDWNIAGGARYFNGTVIHGQSSASSISAGQLVYKTSTHNQWALADADITQAATSLLGICLNTGNSELFILLEGFVNTTYHDQSSTSTSGKPLYISPTAGSVTETAPSSTGQYVRLIGHNWSKQDDTVIYFKPDASWIEL